MAGSDGDGAQPPEGDVVIVVGDGSGNSGRGAPPRRGWPSAARRIGVALGVVAVFVFGIVVGRTSVGHGGVAGPSATSSSTAASVTGSPATTMTDSQTSQTGSSGPVGQRSGTVPSSSVSSESPSPLLDPAFAAAVSVGAPGQSEIEALAVVGDRLVVLTSGWLAEVVVDSHGGLYPGDSAAVGLPLGDPTYAAWQLISGPNAVWAFAPAKRLYSVDASTLETGPLIRVPSGAVDAVALDEHVYLNSDSGVYDVTPSTQESTSLSVVARGGRAIAADPTRHRLLITEDDDGWMVYAYAPPDTAPVAGGSLPFDVTSVAVAGREIWVTGMTTDADPRPVLARLDPATLKVISHSSLEKSLTSAPTVVASGTSLWIRSADSGSQLWCVNATTGAVAQQWPAVPGRVAVGGERAFVAEGNVVGQLRLNGACTG